MNFGQSIDFIYNMISNVFSTNKMTKDKEFTLTRAMVENWYNTAYLQFMRKARVLNDYTTITGVAATQDYTLASTIDGIVGIWYQQGTGSKIRLKSITSDEKAYCDTLVGSPTKYEVYTKSTGAITLRLYPYSSITTADTIHLKVILLPSTLTNDSDVPLIPPGYEFAVTNAVIAQAQLYCGLVSSDTTPLQYSQIYQQMLNDEAARCLSDNENFGNYDFQLGATYENQDVTGV